MKVFTVRASSLPKFADRELSWAARHFDPVKEACLAAITTNGGKPARGIGAIVGSANHFGALEMLKDTHLTGRPNFDIGLHNAIAHFKGEMVDLKTVHIDDLTKSVDAGVKQITKMMEAFYNTYAIHSDPSKYLEHEVFVKINQFLRVGGKLDNLRNNWKLQDYKFGRDLSAYFAQLGAYLAGIAESFENAKNLTAELIWTPRVGVDALQPVARIIPMNAEACLEAFWNVIFKIRDRIQKWNSDRNPKYLIFGRNGDSKYCKKQYCLAWGTDICDQWIDLDKFKEGPKEWATW